MSFTGSPAQDSEAVYQNITDFSICVRTQNSPHHVFASPFTESATHRQPSVAILFQYFLGIRSLSHFRHGWRVDKTMTSFHKNNIFVKTRKVMGNTDVAHYQGRQSIYNIFIINYCKLTFEFFKNIVFEKRRQFLNLRPWWKWIDLELCFG